MRMLLPLFALITTATAAEAEAQVAPAPAPLRNLCSDRPGLGTPPCTVDPGHLQIEVGAGDWTLDRQPDSRTDTIVAGDVLARYGLNESLEARVGWTAYGHERMRDRESGAVSRDSGVGDVTLGLKQHVTKPGSDLSIAVLPFASLPVGRSPAGAGDWGAGLLIPARYRIGKTIQFEFTPEVDAAVDEDRHGRHLAYGGVVGIADALSKSVTATIEYQNVRDHDPSGHETMQLAGLSVAWQPHKMLQLDIGSNIGLDHASPDIQLYFGITRKF